MTILYTILLIHLNWMAPSISEVRKLYNSAATDETTFNKLKALLEKESQRTSLLEGYYGCTLMIEANYLANPISKLNAFNNGKALLEKAIKASPKDVELRYLRFTIQSESPGILNYNSNLKEDKKFILDNYNSINDKTLKKDMVNYLKKSKQLTSTEKNSLNG